MFCFVFWVDSLSNESRFAEVENERTIEVHTLWDQKEEIFVSLIQSFSLLNDFSKESLFINKYGWVVEAEDGTFLFKVAWFSFHCTHDSVPEVNKIHHPWLVRTFFEILAPWLSTGFRELIIFERIERVDEVGGERRYKLEIKDKKISGRKSSFSQNAVEIVRKYLLMSYLIGLLTEFSINIQKF